MISGRTRWLLAASLLALLLDAIVRNVDSAWAALPSAPSAIAYAPLAHFAFLVSAVADWRRGHSSLSARTQRTIAWMLVLYALSILMQLLLRGRQGG